MVSSTLYRHDGQVYMRVSSPQYCRDWNVSSIGGKRGWSALQYYKEFLLFTLREFVLKNLSSWLAFEPDFRAL